MRSRTVTGARDYSPAIQRGTVDELLTGAGPEGGGGFLGRLYALLDSALVTGSNNGLGL
jgi:hypothetical protein